MPCRRRGIGRAWVPKVLELMDKHGCSVLSMAAELQSGHAFMRWLGAEPRMREQQSRLDLRQVNWEMLDRWMREGEAASPSSRLELYSRRMPAGMLDKYCRIRSEPLIRARSP